MARRRRIPFARSRNSLIFLFLSLFILLLLLTSGDYFADKQSDKLIATLDSAQIRKEGLKLYNANCLSCHGVGGRSTSFGPALVNQIYYKGNLSDRAFSQAVIYGAPQRNWDYGPMDPVDGLTQTEIAQILAYIRAEQERAQKR
ncbi:cytochrome c [uncultured Cohaesibacter sp.]|uniref:c-type cytochrome n=1 Tax=uncultured Cohaesibacter sp. TaxID=1002546 RepID=UPI0029C7868C|nr:cytochrome c [uncultured Cohaesibacter sp.]